MKRIKVIEYITNLGDGGAETLVKDYARMIDRNQFDVVIVATRDFGPSANNKQICSAGIPIIYIYPRWNFLIRLWHKIMGLWYVPYRLRQIIRQENASVIHVHLALLRFVRRIGKPLKHMRVFFTCHSIVSESFGAGYRAETKAAKCLVEKNNMRMIAVNNNMKDELNEIFEIDNTVVIRNGIEVSRFTNPEVTKEQERDALGIPQRAYVVGHVGRFNAVKNHMFLVEVFREIAKVKEDAFLLMVGAGNSADVENRLKEYGLAKKFMILAHRSDVNRILRAMDVFVFPSLFESLGIALIEAQASGLKCVVSESVPQDAIRSDRTIALPLDNAQRWAEIVLDENAKGKTYGDLDDYDMTKEIKRLETLYAGITE